MIQVKGKKFYKRSGYEQMIEYKNDQITDCSCTCRWGTTHRDAWKKGENLCRHLRMLIYKKPTVNQKLILRQLVDYTCENCGKHENKVGQLQVHRIKRGSEGGLYVPHNIKMLCDKCHKKIHQGEFK